MFVVAHKDCFQKLISLSLACVPQVVEAQHRVLATHDVSDRDTVPDGLLSELYDIQLDKES